LIVDFENILTTGGLELVFLTMEIKQINEYSEMPSLKKVCQHHWDDEVITRNSIKLSL